MPDTERFLNLLEAIGTSERLTQRDIAVRLRISLGQVNALIHRGVESGWVHCRGNTHYQLTEAGREERYRLMGDRMKTTVEGYRDTQRRIEENLARLSASGIRRVVFYGAGEVAEVALAALDKVSLELVGVVDDYRSGELFFGWPIAPVTELRNIACDAVVVTTFRATETIRERVASLGLPATVLYFFQ